MSDQFIHNLLLKHEEVAQIDWLSGQTVNIKRKNNSPFQAAILKQSLVKADHVLPFLTSQISVIVNFPKIGKWSGEAIDFCEANGKAWGQWSVLLRAINSESPETTRNPDIFFNRRALRQHSRVLNVSFELDHLLLVQHVNGTTLKVALLYEYDLTGNDVRTAWDNLGAFNLLLKTNPNGSILPEAREAANSLGAKVFDLGGTLAYLAKGVF